jgi:uncharacterized protein (TIGR02996 family)
MHEDFERAIIENPNDLASYSAYADWLQEQGDPLGEFLATQLALEDESRPKDARAALKKQERELLAAHELEWLGVLAPHLSPDEKPDPGDEYTSRLKTKHLWRRGFLAELTVSCFTVPLAQALADAPVVRALQKLHVMSTAYNLGLQDETVPRRKPRPAEYRTYDEWVELLGAPLLRSLRVFQYGDEAEPPEDGWCDNHTRAFGLERLVAEMARIEELHLICKSYTSAALFALPNLTNLRVLRMYAQGEPYSAGAYEIPLDVLAANPTLGNLTHLALHPHFAFDRSFIPLRRVEPVFRSPHLKNLTHLQLRLSDMGDDGVRALIGSGVLKRLKWLDLRYGCITDEGARLLVACPDAKNPERIDLSRNAVTATGLAALRTAGVNAVANEPLTQAELNDREYLRAGDFE